MDQFKATSLAETCILIKELNEDAEEFISSKLPVDQQIWRGMVNAAKEGADSYIAYYLRPQMKQELYDMGFTLEFHSEKTKYHEIIWNKKGVIK